MKLRLIWRMVQIPVRPRNPCLVAFQTLRRSEKTTQKTTYIHRHQEISSSPSL